MKTVIKNYAGAILVIAVSILVTAGVAYLVDPKFTIDNESLKWIRVAVASLFAASTLGRCGWSIQTWGGNSPEEILNLKIFKIFYIIGFDLLILSFLLHSR